MPPPSNTARGVALVVLSACCFGAMGMVVKLLANRIGVFELAFFRSAIGLLLLSAYLRHAGVTAASDEWKLLLARGLFGALAMVSYFGALSMIPLAEAVILNYTSPAFTIVFAIAWLGERPSRSTLGFLAIALVGVAVLMRPSLSFSGASPWGYAAGLAAGLFSGGAYATVKRLTGTCSPWIIVWYFAAVTTVLAVPPTLATWVSPNFAESGLLVALATLGTTGQLLMTAGFRHGAVSKTSIATIAVVVVAALGGWLFWNELPDAIGGLGIALIALAIVGISREAPATEPARGDDGSAI